MAQNGTNGTPELALLQLEINPIIPESTVLLLPLNLFQLLPIMLDLALRLLGPFALDLGRKLLLRLHLFPDPLNFFLLLAGHMKSLFLLYSDSLLLLLSHALFLLLLLDSGLLLL